MHFAHISIKFCFFFSRSSHQECFVLLLSLTLKKVGPAFCQACIKLISTSSGGYGRKTELWHINKWSVRCNLIVFCCLTFVLPKTWITNIDRLLESCLLKVLYTFWDLMNCGTVYFCITTFSQSVVRMWYILCEMIASQTQKKINY